MSNSEQKCEVLRLREFHVFCFPGFVLYEVFMLLLLHFTVLAFPFRPPFSILMAANE